MAWRFRHSFKIILNDASEKEHRKVKTCRTR
jgi:hypothetical protein